MPFFPKFGSPINPLIISPAMPNSLGQDLNAMGVALGTAGWPTANKAYYMPVSVVEPVTIAKLMVVNGTVAGNIDVGIYTLDGKLLVSAGSTLQSGTNIVQQFDIPDTYIPPGFYYMAGVMSNTTGQVQVWSPGLAPAKAMGIGEQTNAFPLPATASIAVVTSTLRAPFIGATPRATI